MAVASHDFIEQKLGYVEPAILRMLQHDNAASIYRLP